MSAWVNFILGNGYRSGKLTKIKFKELLTIKAHFFEGGNVQFNQRRDKMKQAFQFTADMK
jgi:hypothetical protein